MQQSDNSSSSGSIIIGREYRLNSPEHLPEVNRVKVVQELPDGWYVVSWSPTACSRVQREELEELGTEEPEEEPRRSADPWTDYLADPERLQEPAELTAAGLPEPESCEAADSFPCDHCVNESYCSAELRREHMSRFARTAAGARRREELQDFSPCTFCPYGPNCPESLARTCQHSGRMSPAEPAEEQLSERLQLREAVRETEALRSECFRRGQELEQLRGALHAAELETVDRAARIGRLEEELQELRRDAPLLRWRDCVRCESCSAVMVPNLSTELPEEEEPDGGYGWTCVNPVCPDGREQLGETEPEDFQALGLPWSLATSLSDSLGLLADIIRGHSPEELEAMKRGPYIS